jgi:MinD-like ATPase involved in chromosome partitioning or flagellar assembly
VRIACLDKSAADRVALQRRIENAYTECRSTLGHARPAAAYPISREELFVSGRPDAIAIGPSWDLERAYSLAKEAREIFPAVPILVLLSENFFSLRALRRFERVTPHVVSVGDDAIRIVHSILRMQDENESETNGELVCVSGVKGGVGATSVVSGLAHAFQAIGKSCVVIDLSPSSVFSIYMGCPRTTSVEYSSILRDAHIPDPAFLEKCLHESPNGVTFLASPAGGTETRELWLRDPSRVELSLSIVDLLREAFDVVIVDMAHSEGLLPFALNCRAGWRLLVSSNDPASVHLLSVEFKNLLQAPGDGEIKIVFNTLSERGLSFSDVRNFIAQSYHYETSEVDLCEIPFDAGAKNWIGSGNTFYTESKPTLQGLLERMCQTIMASEPLEQVPLIGSGRIVQSFKNFFNSKFLSSDRHQKRLPLLGPLSESSASTPSNPVFANTEVVGDKNQNSIGAVVDNSSAIVSEKVVALPVASARKVELSSAVGETVSAVSPPENSKSTFSAPKQSSPELLYQPPKMTCNE